MHMTEIKPGEVAETREEIVIVEVYSPPRVTALLPTAGMAPGFALDLTTCDETGQPWDFDNAAQRAKARQLVRDTEPTVLIGSPMCAAFCQWQSINFPKMDPEKVRTILSRARMHLRFTCELYEMQIKAGQLFLHEHPATATSWAEPCVARIARLPGVRIVRADQCQHGMEGDDHGTTLPIEKPTRWMSNMAVRCLSMSFFST